MLKTQRMLHLDCCNNCPREDSNPDWLVRNELFYPVELREPVPGGWKADG